MNTSLTIKIQKDKVACFEHFDEDLELAIWMETSDVRANMYFSPNQINSIINHLAKQLELIGEPIELLNK